MPNRRVDAGAAMDAGPPSDAGRRTLLQGETCQTAVAIAAGTYSAQSTIGYADDYSGAVSGVNGCTGSDRGRDRVYSVVVPAAMRLTATVAPEGEGFYDPSITVIAGPASSCDARPRRCLASDDSGPAAQENVAFYTNPGPDDETVFVVVDAFDSGDPGGAFTLTVALDTPPAGDTCEDAQTVTAGTLTGQSTVGYSNRYAGGSRVHNCTESTDGRDRVYAALVPPGKRLTATVRPAASYNTSLYLIAGPASSCDASPRVCLASNDSGSAGEPDTARWVNSGDADRTVFIVVDSGTAGASGTFDLEVTIETPPEGDTCANAQPIGSGMYAGQTTVGMANDYWGAEYGVQNCTSSDRGLDRVYRVEVPAGARLTAALAPESGGYDPSITLVAGPAPTCDARPRVCLASDYYQEATATNVVQYTNAGVAAETVFLIIDTWNPAHTGGVFTLTIALEAPPPGDRCQDAEVITAGTLAGQTTVGFTNDYTGGSSANGCTEATAGPDRAYAIAVPSGERLTVTVRPSPDFDASVYLVASPAEGCAASPRVCLAGANQGGAGVSEVVRYINGTDAPQTVFAVVDTPSFAGGTFDITFALERPPAGDTCQSAEPLNPGTPVSHTTVGYINDYDAGSACAGTGGPDRVYRITVPSGQRLTATVAPDAAFDASLSLVAGSACEASPRVCLASSDRGGAGVPETVRYTNYSASERALFVVVDSRSEAGGSFSLTAALEAVSVEGEICEAATPITPGTLPEQTTAGFGGEYDLAATCTGFSTPGRDRVYSIEIPPGQKLSATVLPEGTLDSSLYLLRGCDLPFACLAGSDQGGAGVPESASYTNPSGSAETVLIVVDSYRATDEGGGFTLVTTVVPP